MFFKAFSVVAVTASAHHHLRTGNTNHINNSNEVSPVAPYVEMECGADSKVCLSSQANADIMGFYVCREASLGGARQTTCISPDQGLEGDMCGYCGGDVGATSAIN